MQTAFGIIVFVVVALGIVVALASAVGRGRLYDQIGHGGLSVRDSDDDRDAPSAQAAPAAPTATAGERDAEIRQMLEARNDRRRRRGEPELDVDAEVRRLAAPTVDAGLREEIRALVVARNERRTRAGKPPLDVDAEVERQIRELG